ncbi:MAG TPA: hypothetical protein VNB64_00945, partial [Solirubrobacteraceae bacterium]|nr:hypothetical protein [Solirubrobacteraceae bacterium]
MPHDHPAFEIERIEFVPATAAQGLLRVSGSWAVPADAADAPPKLLVTGAGAERRFAALDPREAQLRAEPWRAAYAVPTALVEEAATRFALEGPGWSKRLPTPSVAERAGSAEERRRVPERRRRDRREREETAAVRDDRRESDRRHEA